ncbi:hypothetical protein [Flexivirga caeni]|uniref:DUF1570 domain-containing protein n=1 Tax=Flexivirga caeni TaxID=2294115 RepID=A0A3M9MFS5_9MICO|nr:hypothetical protein [Flexivirga caeni]RNI24409.1 hypothetical protein EFY87_05490 [Flexivirga caeni]
MSAPLCQPVSRRTACLLGMTAAAALLGGCSRRADAARPTSSAASTAGQAWPGARTLHSGNLLVEGTAPQERLQAVLAAAPTAIARVRRIWGESVLRGRVVIDVPGDDASFRARGGSVEGGTQIAATTTPDGRVVLAPVLFTEVTPAGRVVVLTHELTHLALHQAGLTGVARWIIEGSAEFTAYRSSGLPLAQLAPSVASAVRAGRPPAGPPGDAVFAADPAAAYQQAYAWCRFLAGRFGIPRFVSFVRTADAHRPVAFTTTFGVAAATLRTPYADYLRAELAVPSTS